MSNRLCSVKWSSPGNKDHSRIIFVKVIQNFEVEMKAYCRVRGNEDKVMERKLFLRCFPPRQAGSHIARPLSSFFPLEPFFLLVSMGMSNDTLDT